MKHVFTDISKVAHLWANKEQSARNSGNFYFEGDTIYSYGSHFPIAKHVTNDKGESGVLFTERGYSVSTSRHIQVVRQACRHLNIVYCFNPESSHEQNFKSWQHAIENIIPKLTVARKPQIYLSQIQQVEETAKQYAAFWGIEIPAALQAACAITNKEDYHAYKAKKEAYEKEEEKKRLSELKRRHKKELDKWMKGETHRLYTHDGFDYLRVKDGRIQTSQAVEIPMEIGKEIWNSVALNTLQVGDKVLTYFVREVGDTIRVGCHTFKRSYLLKFGESVFN